jgi:hypothetical protein
MEPKPKSSSFYSVFENTLDYLKNSISFSSQPEPDNTPNTKLKTPLENEKIILEDSKSKKKIKNVLPQIAGTKLFFMVERYEKEDVYMYI